MRRALAAACIAAACIAAGGLASPAQAACGGRLLGAVPLSVVNDVPVVTLSANGRPLTMILDTGAELTTLTPAAAARIGAEPPRIELDHRLQGIGGSIGTRQVELRSFAAGPVALQWRRLLVASVTIAAASSAPLDGLLGADVLSDYDLEVDVGRRRLAFHEKQDCAEAAPDWPAPYATFPAGRSASGHLFFPVLLDGRRAAAIFDTGAQRTTVSAATAGALGVGAESLARDRKLTADGAAGERIASRLHRFATLELGGETVRDPALVVTELALRDADVVLGMDLLAGRRLWLAYGAGRVFLGRG